MLQSPTTPASNPTADEQCDCQKSDLSLNDSALETDVETLAAIGSKTRYEVLRRIAATDDGACGCELEPAVDVSQGAVSQALSKLHDAGLVTRRKQGRWRYYSATPRAERLLRVLDETRSNNE